LPAPDVEASKTTYEAPRDEMESLLCDIWADVLGVEQVGIHDNFFFLGGDSIKGIQMASRLTQTGWKLEMKQLFQYPTIADIRPYIEVADVAIAHQSPVEGEVILTPIQRWFFERKFTNQHHWNQSVMLHAPNGFDPDVTEKVIQKLVEHHDALRIVFQVDEEKIVQYNQGLLNDSITLDVIELKGDMSHQMQQVEQIANEVQASINLTEGPLLKPVIFHTDQGDHLLFAVHHLVIDGVSWRIFLEDFTSLYEQAKHGESFVLPDKTHSFQEYAQRLTEYAMSKELLSEQTYWKNVLRHDVKPFPKDHSVTDQRMKHTSTCRFSLTTEETKQLLTDVHEAYHTDMNDILLTALGLSMKQWTGEDHQFIHLEGHGREEVLSHVNLSRTVGWFTSMYPILLDMSYANDLSYQIKHTKEELRHIPKKGVGYGVLKYLTPDKMKEEIPFDVVPEVSFNYLGQFDQEMGAGDVRRSNWSTGHSISPQSEKPHALDIVGFIEHGILTITIAYHALEFHEETVERLKEQIKTNLKNIMSHCITQDESQLTPSDVGDDDLTMDELEKLMDIF
ncbi:condensation domain-containing protein, partial [Bacillus sp. NPDC077027]|uniref:condensation domain-containing protein n=1 Tax=Bacillus sp. NPDC077027 TaxID=3390548 RepID=UPI003D06D762